MSTIRVQTDSSTGRNTSCVTHCFVSPISIHNHSPNLTPGDHWSLHEMFPWYLSFSWRDLYYFPFCCFPLFLCIGHWGTLSYLSLLFFGTLHSNGHIFSPLPLASLLFSAICKASSDSHFAFLHFFFLGMVLITASCTCHESPSIVLQALYEI